MGGLLRGASASRTAADSMWVVVWMGLTFFNDLKDGAGGILATVLVVVFLFRQQLVWDF